MATTGQTAPKARPEPERVVSDTVAANRAQAALPKVHTVINAIMREVLFVGKDQEMKEGPRYRYRGIDDVILALGPAMRRHGLLMLPTVEWSSRRDTRSGKDKPMRETLVRVRWTLVGPAGDTLSVVTEGESLDTSDKGTAKAQTVSWRVALIQAFSLPTDEPDPDSEYPERGDDREARRGGRVNDRREDGRGDYADGDDAGDPDAEDRDRELTILRRKARELGVSKDAVAEVFGEIFGQDLRVGEPALIGRFTGWLIAWGRLPTVTELSAQHPDVAKMIAMREEQAAQVERDRARQGDPADDDRNGPGRE